MIRYRRQAPFQVHQPEAFWEGMIRWMGWGDRLIEVSYSLSPTLACSHSIHIYIFSVLHSYPNLCAVILFLSRLGWMGWMVWIYNELGRGGWGK